MWAVSSVGQSVPQYCGKVRGLKNMHKLYIIQSLEDSSYYIGQTDNLDDRLKRHNQGRSKATKNKRPWKLVYTEEFETRSEAMKREYEIKRKKRKSYIEWLIKNNVGR